MEYPRPITRRRIAKRIFVSWLAIAAAFTAVGICIGICIGLWMR